MPYPILYIYFNSLNLIIKIRHLFNKHIGLCLAASFVIGTTIQFQIKIVDSWSAFVFYFCCITCSYLITTNKKLTFILIFLLLGATRTSIHHYQYPYTHLPSGYYEVTSLGSRLPHTAASRDIPITLTHKNKTYRLDARWHYNEQIYYGSKYYVLFKNI